MAPKQNLAEWALSATPEQLQRGDWRIVCAGLKTAKQRFADAELGNQSWLDCYIQIAESRGKEPDPTALATQPQAPQGAVPDLRGVDGGTVDEWLDLIAHRLVKRDTVLIRAVDAPKAMTPYERRAAPETPEGQK